MRTSKFYSFIAPACLLLLVMAHSQGSNPSGNGPNAAEEERLSAPHPKQDSLLALQIQATRRDSISKILEHFTSLSKCDSVPGFLAEDKKVCKDILKMRKPFLIK